MGISVEGANKRFGDFQALDDVSIDVPDGSLTALLGPSGSGKSTLLRAIAGLEDLDAGLVTINGENATSKPPQQRGQGPVRDLDGYVVKRLKVTEALVCSLD